MYEHKYKHGKQKTIMPLSVFEAAMKDAINQGESLEHLAFVTLLWHTGVRKSEAYERLMSDVAIIKDFVIVDFHKRKKGGDEVPPLKIPREFYGIEDFLIPWIVTRLHAKPPHKNTKKNLFYQLETDETRETETGKTVSVKKTVYKTVKDFWLFPHIQSHTAWEIVKRVLGPEYYPHYLRLRKLSRIGGNPKTKSIIHLKSLSGIKSIRALQAYMGIDQEAQDQAMQENE